MNYTRHKLILLIFGLLIIGSCIDKKEFDFERLSLSNINPVWAVPLVSDSIYLKAGEYIEFEDNNAILVFNRKFDDFNLKVLDSLFNLPQQELKWSSPVSIPADLDGVYDFSLNYTASTPLKFPTMEDINASEIRIDSVFIDNLDMAFQPIVLPDMSGNFTVTIYSLLQGKNPFVFKVLFPSVQNNHHHDNYVLKLTQNSPKGKNLLSYRLSTYSEGTFEKTAGTTIDFGCNTLLKNLKLAKIFSYVGKQKFDILDSIPIDAAGLSGNIQINALDIKFEVDNSIGIPVALNLHELRVVTEKGENKKAIGFKPIYIKSADIKNLRAPVKTIDSIDDKILIPLFGDLPKQIYFDLSLETNPKGEIAGTTNFLVPDSKIDLTAHIRVPLNLSVQDLIFADTIAFDMAKDWRKMVDNMFFRLKVSNHFPLDIAFQATMLDSTNMPVGTLFETPIHIKTGKYNPTTSEVTESASFVENIPFGKFRLDQLQKTRRIFLSVKASTFGNSNLKVKINRKNFVIVKMGVTSTIHLNEVL